MKVAIHESNLIENIDDPKEDKQSLVAWNWLKKQPRINHYEVIHLHELITKNQGVPGGFRNQEVRVGNYYPPVCYQVPYLMDNWLMDLWESIDPMDMHIKFERIHPFLDGNGRTGRMLMWWHEAKLGISPTIFKASEKQEYYIKLAHKEEGE